MVADALYIEILHKILVCNSGAWVACRPCRARSPLDCSVQGSHAHWTACCSPGPVQTPDWTDWTIKNTAVFSLRLLRTLHAQGALGSVSKPAWSAGLYVVFEEDLRTTQPRFDEEVCSEFEFIFDFRY
jgi:hypothetical protein